MASSDAEINDAGGWLKHLLLQLVDGAARDAAKMNRQADLAFHRLRVRMKRAVALLRLGKAAVEKGKRQKMRSEMRRIKDGCSSQRDALVIAKLAGELGDKFGLHLVQSPLGEMAPLERSNLISLIDRLRPDIAAENFEGLTWDQIRKAYSDAYKVGKRCMRKARKTQKAEDFHEWRKCVKRLHFQMTALHGAVHHLRKRMRRTQKLGHLLGCDHDLTLLEYSTRGQAPGSPWEKIIARKRKRLRARIFKLGEKVYVQPVHRFARLRRLPTR